MKENGKVISQRKGWSQVSNMVEAEDSEDCGRMTGISTRRLFMNCFRQKSLWTK